MLCKYNCGNEAKYGQCCSDFPSKCPVVRRKNSEKLKQNKRNIKKYKCSFCNRDFLHYNLKTHENNCVKNPDYSKNKKCKLCGESLKYGVKYCGHICANIDIGKLYRNGKNHPLWQGGEFWYRNACIEEYGYKCFICEFDKIIKIHHIDGNHKNNVLENLVPLCPNHHELCHDKKFKNGVNKLIEKKMRGWKCSKDIGDGVSKTL